MKIAIGSDHAGLDLKEHIKSYLLDKKFEVIDVGTNEKTSTDYPIYARAVCKKIQKNEADLGILICGSGIGMSITANKFKKVRAALCTNEYMARMSRAHNNANVLCMGERVIGKDLAISIVEAWLSASFEGGRHERRVSLISEYEKEE